MHCIVQPVFLTPERWIELPSSWSRSIQRGKLYSTDEADGLHLWNLLENPIRPLEMTRSPGMLELDEQTRYGTPTLIAPRLGQGAFRVAVTEAYDRQCAITAGKVLPALDAAHIKPYAEGGLHVKSNGILLRKDIHSVFDAGYVTIDEKFKFTVSSKIKEIFNNGEEYFRLHGKALRLPNRKDDWPDRSLLRWHNENKYVG